MFYKFLSKINAIRIFFMSQWYGRFQNKYNLEIPFSRISNIFPSRDASHAYAHHYFHNRIDSRLRNHRKYFRSNGRGYGEDAFHAMWFLLLKEFRPENCLEIGVFRGQTISLFSLIASILGYECNVFGLSPFSSSGDAVSTYGSELNYLEDVKFNCAKFNTKMPNLVKGLSTDPHAISFIKSRLWDLIYIDGNHDYEVALSDYLICKDNLKLGGILVLDDSSLYTDFSPPIFSFAGHPGPSRIVSELASHELEFVGAVGHNNIFRKFT